MDGIVIVAVELHKWHKWHRKKCIILKRTHWGIKNTATGSQRYHRFCADNDNATSSAVKQAKETPPPKTQRPGVFNPEIHQFINLQRYSVVSF